MPRNGSGVYSLPDGNPVVAGTVIESDWANPTMSDLGNEITGSLPRNGTAPMLGPLFLAGDATLPLQAVTKRQMETRVQGDASFLPAGTVMDFSMAAIPAGWLIADGRAVGRSGVDGYPELFAAYLAEGLPYGAGNGTTTFNLPNYCGMFRRGLDMGRGLDVGRTLSNAYQESQNTSHTHATTVTDPGHTHTGTANHNHTLNDPTHSHSSAAATARLSINDVNARWMGSGGEGASGTITVGAVSTGITIDAANPAVALSTNATGVTVANAVNGGEGHPANMAVVTCVKAYGTLMTGLPSGIIHEIFSSDDNMLEINNLDVQNPIIEVKTNLPFGIPKLDANGQIPAGLLPTSGLSLVGTFDASAGDNPSEAYPTMTFVRGNTFLVGTAGTIDVFNPATNLSAPTAVSVGWTLVYISGSLINPTGWYFYGPAASVMDLGDLADVDAPTPADGDALLFNSATGNWEPGTAGEGAGYELVAEGGYADGATVLLVDIAALAAEIGAAPWNVKVVYENIRFSTATDSPIFCASAGGGPFGSVYITGFWENTAISARRSEAGGLYLTNLINGSQGFDLEIDIHRGGNNHNSYDVSGHMYQASSSVGALSFVGQIGDAGVASLRLFNGGTFMNTTTPGRVSSVKVFVRRF